MLEWRYNKDEHLFEVGYLEIDTNEFKVVGWIVEELFTDSALTEDELVEMVNKNNPNWPALPSQAKRLEMLREASS